jgi:uncharacterized membrane protein
MEALIFSLYVIPFLLAFYFAFLFFLIRPPKRVWLFSLLGGLVTGIVNMLVDIVAYYSHWWHYSLVQTGLDKPNAFQASLANGFLGALNTLHIPLPFYLTPILIYGSLAYLLIWRFWFGKARWFSWVLLAAIPLLCILKDVLGGLEDASYQVWTNVPLAILMTVVMWLVAFFLGFLLFWPTARQIAFVPQTEEPLQVPSSKHAPNTSK